VSNPKTQAGSKTLQLNVAQGKAPLAVNAGAGKATNLNADEVDGQGFGCPGGTLLHEGVCIEVAKCPANAHALAHQDCTDEGKRLPSVEELLTFRDRSGHDFAGPNAEWTLQIEYNGTALGAIQVSANGSVGWASSGGSGITNYRCVALPA